MATTISIDDEIFEQLRARAEREATTVNRLIEDSLRGAAMTRDEHTSDKPFELVTFGKGGQFTSYDVDRTSALIELDDIATHRN
ncbi:MAG: hypothetical protein JO093_18580 [Acidobacteria bacterium]|nr:hypothetical protein [Acidobacteriota bacterium]MBV9068190.1 hypothetical protein [Acidobacteriota bacterium]MBV9187629.1 hypothetical protein [Acidobacteriota bacterium]